MLAAVRVASGRNRPKSAEQRRHGGKLHYHVSVAESEQILRAPSAAAAAGETPRRAVELTPITDADVPAVADFFHAHLNDRVPLATWIAAMSAPWRAEAPNRGFMLRDGQHIVGAQLAFYAERTIAGRTERFCNLAALCVLPDFRIHSVRLLTALLAQDGYHFTDLSPTGNVIPLNARLKFRFLDTSAALVPNLPWPTVPNRTKISADPDVIASALTGADLEVYSDHASAVAVRHLVLIRGSDSCHVMFREIRAGTLPVFATILYVSNPELFRRATGRLARYLLVRHRLLATLAELRTVRYRPRLSVMLRTPLPPKMYRSATLDPAQVDDLYSELACVPW
jgi:hypothetical protein